MVHIDDWLNMPAQNEGEILAKEWLNHFRRPAIEKDHAWLDSRQLYCTFKSERYRCIGASRLGDVWLTKDFNRKNGYDLRIDVSGCSDWTMSYAS